MKKKVIIIFIIVLSFVFIYEFLSYKKNPQEIFKSLLKKEKIENPNIIIFTLDTLRADHLHAYGYDYSLNDTPTLDKMAQEGIIFEECITTVPLTLPSHSSIMTGMLPTYHGIRINGNNALSEKQITVAEKLKKKGYLTAAFIGAFVLDGRWGLKQGFDYYDDFFDLEKYKTLDLGRVQRPANEVIDSALKWLDNNKNKRFFTWIHLYDPHTPYAPPEPYFSEYRDRGRKGLYDGEISFMDSQIERVINWLELNHLRKKTIMIFVGDHGESLGDHKEDTHGYFIYDSTLRVPLIIVTPFKKLKNIRVKPQVRTIDIFPTVLDILGLNGKSEVHGKSLIPLFFKPEKGKDRLAYSESLSPRLQYNWGALYSLRSSKFKYIEAPRPEFYNLMKDPKELTNIFRKHLKIMEEYRKKLYEIKNTSGENAPEPENVNMDEKSMEKLATLGYLGVAVAGKTSLKENRELPDPKDRIELFNMISLASEHISEGKYDKALELLENVVKKDPNNPQIRLLLASSYLKQKKFEKAKAQLDSILKKNPDNLKALITLANLFYAQKKAEETRAVCSKILSIEKNYTQALSLMGKAYILDDNLEKAYEYLKKAVDVQPKINATRLELAKCLISMKRYDEAIKEINTVIEHHGDFPEAHYHLALIYEDLGEYSKAEEEYLKEIKNHPNYIPARFNYARLIFNYDLEEYIKQMKKIIKINPKAARAYLFMARGLLKEGETLEKIKPLVDKGLNLTEDPELKALGYYLFADIYSKEGNNLKLREVLKKAKYYESKIKKKEM